MLSLFWAAVLGNPKSAHEPPRSRTALRRATLAFMPLRAYRNRLRLAVFLKRRRKFWVLLLLFGRRDGVIILFIHNKNILLMIIIYGSGIIKTISIDLSSHQEPPP